MAVVAALTALTTGADASMRGIRSLPAMNRVMGAFPSCSRNTLHLFHLHPVRVDLSPYHEGVVGRDIENVVEDDQGPACGYPPAAVCSDHLV